MGLLPLEFTDCLTDSPYFREKLHAHEKELENTSQQIKTLIKNVKDLVTAAKNLSRAQRAFAHSLKTFHFECIGNSQTDDEIIISKSLSEFGNLVSAIEEERDRMLNVAYDNCISPLEEFRKTYIGGVKEGKKKFDKQTAKFCQSQERYLNLSTKKQETVLQEADATLEMEQRHFIQASLQYVFLLQEVQERKKFQFVETLLGFIYSWLTFYHQGHEVAQDSKAYMKDLQCRIQKTRDNFDATRDETENLMKKTLETRKTKAGDLEVKSKDKMYTREGYLFLMEKKAFGTTWSKNYCCYQKENKVFTMISYNQIQGKFMSTESMKLKSCVRRISDSIEKRFCFDITAEDKPGLVYTLQALSEEDRQLWMNAMDGIEPNYAQPGKVSRAEETCLDELGFIFIKKCIAELENRGLEEQGLYRLVGVSSKVTKLLTTGFDRKRPDKMNLEDRCEWETKTITSALKQYFRNLPEPIMTFQSHNEFIDAAKLENRIERIYRIHCLVHQLPVQNFQMLDIIVEHLKNVAEKHQINRMTVSNLGVCFGPTLLRPEEESVAAIIDIKFCNVVVEILIENHKKIFKQKPDPAELSANLQQSPLRNMSLPRSPNHYVSPQQTNQQRDVHVYSHSPQHIMKAEPQYIAANNHSVAKPSVAKVISSYNDGPWPVHLASQRPMYNSSTSLHHTERGDWNTYNDGVPELLKRSPRSNATNHGDSPLSHPPGNSVSSNPDIHMGMMARPCYFENKLAGGKMADIYANSSNSSVDSAMNSQRSNNHVSYTSSPIPMPRAHRHENANGGTPLSYMSNSYTRPSHEHQSSGSQSSSSLSGGRSSPANIAPVSKTVRTLFSCQAERPGELTFEPNEIIVNVKQTDEQGWLEGTLKGETGLFPQNYVQFIT